MCGPGTEKSRPSNFYFYVDTWWAQAIFQAPLAALYHGAPLRAGCKLKRVKNIKSIKALHAKMWS